MALFITDSSRKDGNTEADVVNKSTAFQARFMRLKYACADVSLEVI